MKKLTQEDVKYYSKRLVHFLRGVRRRSNFSQEQVANLIDYSLSHYRKLETEGYADEGKFINAIDLLCTLGDLEKMNLHQFCLYLDNPEALEIEEFLDKFKESDAQSEKRQIYPWEKLILTLFNKIDMDTRVEFTERFMPNKDSADGLIRLIKFALIVDEVVFKKLNVFNLKIFDAMLEFTLIQLKNKSEHRVSNVKTLLSKLFSDK